MSTLDSTVRPAQPADDGDGKLKADVLIIDGMFCAACAASVDAAIRRHPSVREVSVNFAAEAAVIERDAAADGADLDALAERIARLGYSARSANTQGTPAAAAARRADHAARDLSLRLVVGVFFGMWVMLPSIGLYLDAGAGDPQVQWRLAVGAGLLSLPVVLWSGLPFYRMAWNTLRAGAAGIDALVTIGTAGALLLSILALWRGSAAVYFEVAVALITLQLLARLIDLRVRRRAREAISALLELTPTRLRQVTAAGEQELTLNEVKAGVRLRILPGERLAVDGVVHEGTASIDRSLLTGESTPRTLHRGDSAHAGERLLDGSVILEVTAGPGGRRLDALAKQVRQMLATKAPWQRVVDRLARYFLWLSLALGALAGTVVVALGGSIEDGALRALAVFVIACPCALSLAAPLAGLCASQAAARRGIILRDLNAITSAARPHRIFFDKTGTLTAGRPAVSALHPEAGTSADTLLRYAGQAERLSEHPLARGIVTAATQRGLLSDVPASDETVTVTPGRGLRVEGQDGVVLHVGSLAWFEDLGLPATAAPSPTPAATRVCVARNRQLLGTIDLIDEPRPGIADALERLRDAGLELAMLSGDAQAPVAHLGEQLGISWHAALTPEQKVEHVQGARREGQEVIAFVGDGLNDGPALAAADLGIAVGPATDAARAAAAISLTQGGVERLPEILALTQRLRRVVRRNLTWAIAYNVVALPAAAAGLVHPALAAGAMALSSISIILSAARAGAE